MLELLFRICGFKKKKFTTWSQKGWSDVETKRSGSNHLITRRSLSCCPHKGMVVVTVLFIPSGSFYWGTLWNHFLRSTTSILYLCKPLTEDGTPEDGSVRPRFLRGAGTANAICFTEGLPAKTSCIPVKGKNLSTYTTYSLCPQTWRAQVKSTSGPKSHILLLCTLFSPLWCDTQGGEPLRSLRLFLFGRTGYSLPGRSFR